MLIHGVLTAWNIFFRSYTTVLPCIDIYRLLRYYFSISKRLEPENISSVRIRKDTCMSRHKEIINEIEMRDGRLLVIRKPDAEDAAEIIAYLNTVGGESDNLLFGKDEFHLSVEQEIEYIDGMNRNPDAYLILAVINETIVSVAQICSSNRPRIAHNSEVAISVKKEYWGEGIGTAVLGELIAYAKARGSIRTVSLGVRAGNANAIKLYEKFEFEKVGVHKDYFYVNGRYYDEILMDATLHS